MFTLTEKIAMMKKDYIQTILSQANRSRFDLLRSWKAEAILAVINFINNQYDEDFVCLLDTLQIAYKKQLGITK